MATGQKISAQTVATSFDSTDLMTIVQAGANKSVDHDVLMDDTQICKAWVNYNGQTNTINGNFNVSSITDNATGDYTVNYTNNMNNVNYTASFSTTGQVLGDIRRTVCIAGTDAGGATLKTVSSLRIQSGITSGVGLIDMADVNVQIFGS